MKRNKFNRCSNKSSQRRKKIYSMDNGKKKSINHFNRRKMNNSIDNSIIHKCNVYAYSLIDEYVIQIDKHLFLVINSMQCKKKCKRGNIQSSSAI